MATKFLIVIGAVVAVMAALVLLPSFNKGPAATDQTQLSLEYSRQHLSRIENGQFAATGAEMLTIGNDGSAKYSKLVGAPDEKTFRISSDDLKRLKDLILETGFMQIPDANYPQREGLASVTQYTLKVSAGGSTKTINWVDPDSNDSVPSIIGNVGAQLDDIIARYAS
ncbi:MAG TPA: hypothetical protein VHL10_10160 [Nitrososphaera sp.]|nr:hypothetical protein [Nitrososphaera sp.]